MRYTRIPTLTLPVDLAALMTHMRVDFDANECTRLALVATREIEAYCDIALTRTTISLSLDAKGGDVIELPVGPLAPDALVTASGIETTTGIEGGRWPRITLPDAVTGPVVITYEAGFGDTAASVPEDLAHAVMDQAGQLFDQRGAVDAKQGLSIAAARICARHRGVAI